MIGLALALAIGWERVWRNQNRSRRRFHRQRSGRLGHRLPRLFRPNVQVINLALNGRSSKSFRDEGAWAPALAAKPDYILIQFGHNDGPGKGPERETDPRPPIAPI